MRREPRAENSLPIKEGVTENEKGSGKGRKREEGVEAVGRAETMGKCVSLW